MRQRLRAEAEEDTVKLALAIARRVLHRELAMRSGSDPGPGEGRASRNWTRGKRIGCASRPQDAATIQRDIARS